MELIYRLDRYLVVDYRPEPPRVLSATWYARNRLAEQYQEQSGPVMDAEEMAKFGIEYKKVET